MRLENRRAALVVVVVVLSAHAVAHKRRALRIGHERHVGEKVIALHEDRAVVHLEEEVALVRPHPVADDARALRHPVEPDAADVAAVVDAAVGDREIDRRVDLDAGHLRAAVGLLPVAVRDVAVVDGGEHRAERAADAGLSAVRDAAAAHEVAAHAVEAVGDAAQDRVVVVLRGGAHVVELVAVLAERDAAALRAGHLAVLNHPPPAPVGAHDSHLLARRRRPVGPGVDERDAAQDDVVAVFDDGIETRRAHDQLGHGDVRILLESGDNRAGDHAVNQDGVARLDQSGEADWTLQRIGVAHAEEQVLHAGGGVGQRHLDRIVLSPVARDGRANRRERLLGLRRIADLDQRLEQHAREVELETARGGR